MELRQRVRGPVDAVERSPVFAQAICDRAASDELGEGQVWRADLLDAALPANTYDLIYARWVFCFLPEVQSHVHKLVRALKPGGLLAIQDYAHRESFALFPRPTEWLDFLAADRAFFASQGGDISIGGRLPAIFKRAGLGLVDVTPVHRSGPPGSLVWEWLWGFFQSIRNRYGSIQPFDAAKAQRVHKHWHAAAGDKRSFVVAPTMVDLVGQKPLRRSGSGSRH